MKRYRLLALFLALAMAFTFTACSSTGNPPQSSGAPAASTPTDGGAEESADPAFNEDDGKTYTLTYSYHTSESIGPGQFIVQAAQNIEERSNGRLILDCYFNGTLLKISDVVTGCINGIADVVFVDATIISESFTLNNVFSMPYLNTPPGKAETDAAYAQLIEDCPELAEEMAKQGLMWTGISTVGGHHLHGTTVMDSPAALVGKTVEGLGEGGNIITALGGNGVVLDPGDYYLSMSTGLLDGMLLMFGEMYAFGLHELLPAHVIFSNSTDTSDYDAMFGGGLYSPMMGTIMNVDSYHSLPADLQEILLDELGKFAPYITALDIPTIVVPGVDECVERGDDFIFINDEARQEWSALLVPVLEKWYERCDTAGYDGEAVYGRLIELFEASA